MFRRKRKVALRELSEEFSEKVKNEADEAHRAKLASETRTCSTCGYYIRNPMTDRCPRCFTVVPPSDHTNCGECDFQGNCALADLQRLRDQQ